MRRLAFLAVLTFWGGAVPADPVALVLGVERYQTLGRALQGATVVDAGPALTGAGFEVSSAPNPTGQVLRDVTGRFAGQVAGAETVVVALAGRFATDGTRTWLLGQDARAPTLIDVGAQGLSLDSIMRLMAVQPGRAVLLLGVDSLAEGRLDDHLREGLALTDIPQGLTVVTGTPGAVADLLAETVGRPGADVMADVRSNRRLRLHGFQPRTLVLVPAGPLVPQPPVVVDTAAEDALWTGTRALDTAQAYFEYLNRYPAGRYVTEATAALDAIQNEPNRQDRLGEEALGLGRDTRRSIQRQLTLLDFDTRGIDGIFGPGTRRAIANWQQQNGYPQTTYLTTDQINRLDAQASVRAAEIEAEAERQRAAEEGRDRAYWEETGARNDEAGLRAYLDRYPDGLFAAAAQDLLAAIDAEKRGAAEAADRAAWDTARLLDTPSAYRDYLSTRPDGAFRTEATSRIAALDQQAQNAGSRDTAAAAETELRVDPFTARLIEARLQELGLEPGRVDGQLDDNSRRAIRRYQRDRGLAQSGYLNQQTVARLLADSIGELGR